MFGLRDLLLELDYKGREKVNEFVKIEFVFECLMFMIELSVERWLLDKVFFEV